jgi:hypothetical protein
MMYVFPFVFLILLVGGLGIAAVWDWLERAYERGIYMARIGRYDNVGLWPVRYFYNLGYCRETADPGFQHKKDRKRAIYERAHHVARLNANYKRYEKMVARKGKRS